jgi:hypothetical protein
MAVKIGIAILSLGCIASTSAAFAQTSATSSGLASQQPPSTIQNGRSESLSSKLNQSGGVIKPTEDVDPGMKKAAPVAHPNSTPVIPPSATGGENAK